MKLTLENIIKSILNESITSDKVLDSIRNRYFVRIRYDDGKEGKGMGDPKGSRIIQPMAIGTTKKGHPVLRAFQFDGNSRKGAPNWKFFRLDRITSWRPMPNKHFSQPPDPSYGEYNYFGDRSMGTFTDNAKFDEFNSPLSMLRAKREMPKISVKNSKGPIQADKQWKKNVYTSQPNSSKYAQYAKNIDDTSNEVDRFNDDIWAAAERERDSQNQTGPIRQQKDYDEYDIDDTYFNEDDFIDNNNRRR